MKIALVDDEERWRKVIYPKVEAYFPEADIQVFSSGEAFLERAEKYEIVFMDVEMGAKDGFETAAEYKEYNSDAIIMILTTHAEMVKRGFAVNAFRYLDKVNVDEELKEAVFAIKKLFAKNKKILVPIIGMGDKIFELKEIVYVETEKRNIIIHTWDKKFNSKMGMAEIEKMLGNAFFRCHKSYIVNLDMVKTINRIDLDLKNGENIFLSIRKSSEFKQRYLNWKYEYANA
ncbi:MAG: response regulator transcription factor [Lachnospiraceae bacterium]|nr:response regulator transcription factor [Lachnospiraceae bacterium]